MWMTKNDFISTRWVLAPTPAASASFERHALHFDDELRCANWRHNARYSHSSEKAHITTTLHRFFTLIYRRIANSPGHIFSAATYVLCDAYDHYHIDIIILANTMRLMLHIHRAPPSGRICTASLQALARSFVEFHLEKRVFLWDICAGASADIKECAPNSYYRALDLPENIYYIQYFSRSHFTHKITIFAIFIDSWWHAGCLC